MYAKNSQINPSADVTNSIIYQVANSAVDRLKNIVNVTLLTIEKEEQPPVVTPPPAVPAKEPNKSAAKSTTVKQTVKTPIDKQAAANSKTTDKQPVTTPKESMIFSSSRK